MGIDEAIAVSHEALMVILKISLPTLGITALLSAGLMLFQSGRREAALPYVEDAAKRGDPRSEYLLGIAYFNGDLVGKDWVKAYALLTLANSAGLPQAAPALAQTPAAQPSAHPASCPAVLKHTFNRLQDEAPQDLCQYAGKVVLVVNTASYCGYTKQYDGLEKLYAKYAPRGLVVLGFPSNDFKQEDADAKKIADLCYNTYGVKFPMFTSTVVTGTNANPLYSELIKATGISMD